MSKVAVESSISKKIVSRPARPSRLFRYGLNWNPVGNGYIRGDLFVLHSILAALLGSMMLCEVFYSYIWHEYEDWGLHLFVLLSLTLGVGFFVMISGNLHGAGILNMILGFMMTAGITTLGALAPWKALHSDIEEDVLWITVVCVGSLASFFQFLVLVKRLTGSRRSSVDNYLEASRDYTAWIIKGRPVARHKSCCSLRQRKRKRTKDDDHWSRSTFGKRRASKCNPFRFVLTDGIHFIPAVVTLAFVMGTVFVLVLSFKLHFFFLENRDLWINAESSSSDSVDEIRDVILGAFNSRTRRFLFGKNLTLSYDLNTTSTSLVDLDVLLSWIVRTLSLSLSLFSVWVTNKRTHTNKTDTRSKHHSSCCNINYIFTN
jgi:hypothetical protein